MPRHFATFSFLFFSLPIMEPTATSGFSRNDYKTHVFTKLSSLSLIIRCKIASIFRTNTVFAAARYSTLRILNKLVDLTVLIRVYTVFVDD